MIREVVDSVWELASTICWTEPRYTLSSSGEKARDSIQIVPAEDFMGSYGAQHQLSPCLRTASSSFHTPGVVLRFPEELDAHRKIRELLTELEAFKLREWG